MRSARALRLIPNWEIIRPRRQEARATEIRARKVNTASRSWIIAPRKLADKEKETLEERRATVNRILRVLGSNEACTNGSPHHLSIRFFCAAAADHFAGSAKCPAKYGQSEE